MLSTGQEPLEMLFVEPSADVALIQSGEPFRHLYFVQHGMIVPWQYPYSELSSPFLIGDHEFMMGAERWVASYSAATQTIVVAIPVATMRLAVERIPQIHAKMDLVLLRRMARYYWISLATNGSPAPRVAAALMSRLALNGEDHGCEREVTLRQRDIVRLTVMSRSAVAGGISTLAAEELIRIGDDNSERFSGLVHVPDVDRLNPNPPMRSGLGVGTRGEGRGTRRSALDSDKWGRWRPLVGVGGADGGPGQRRWGGVGGTACKGRQSRTGPVRLCGVVE